MSMAAPQGAGLNPRQRVWLGQIMDMLEAHLGDHVELVLHDLTLDYEGTVIDIRNGYISGRKIGDGGDNMGLTVVRGTNPSGDRFNYLEFPSDGRILRCSTVFFRDEQGHPVASLCINEDITKSVEMENFLHARNQGTPENVIHDVNLLLESLLEEAQLHVGKSSGAMNREEKKAVIRYLDEHGAFLISKSGPRVCEVLGISKFTLYNYLDAIRNQTEPPAEK